jgi:hypothetical protein
LTTQNNNDSVTDAASTQHLHEISDNGSIVLGWFVIAIMIVFGAISVATHESQVVNMVESESIATPVSEKSEAEGVTHSIEKKQPTITIEEDNNLIQTRILI